MYFETNIKMQLNNTIRVSMPNENQCIRYIFVTKNGVKSQP